MRVDAVKKPLTPPYDGPFPVLQRGQKNFTVLKNNKDVVVSIDRLKPAFLDFLPAAGCVTPATTPRPPCSRDGVVHAGDLGASEVDGDANRRVASPVLTRSGRQIVVPDRLGF